MQLAEFFSEEREVELRSPGTLLKVLDDYLSRPVRGSGEEAVRRRLAGLRTRLEQSQDAGSGGQRYGKIQFEPEDSLALAIAVRDVATPEEAAKLQADLGQLRAEGVSGVGSEPTAGPAGGFEVQNQGVVRRRPGEGPKVNGGRSQSQEMDSYDQPQYTNEADIDTSRFLPWIGMRDTSSGIGASDKEIGLLDVKRISPDAYEAVLAMDDPLQDPNFDVYDLKFYTRAGELRLSDPRHPGNDLFWNAWSGDWTEEELRGDIEPGVSAVKRLGFPWKKDPVKEQLEPEGERAFYEEYMGVKEPEGFEKQDPSVGSNEAGPSMAEVFVDEGDDDFTFWRPGEGPPPIPPEERPASLPPAEPEGEYMPIPSKTSRELYPDLWKKRQGEGIVRLVEFYGILEARAKFYTLEPESNGGGRLLAWEGDEIEAPEPLAAGGIDELLAALYKEAPRALALAAELERAYERAVSDGEAVRFDPRQNAVDIVLKSGEGERKLEPGYERDNPNRYF